MGETEIWQGLTEIFRELFGNDDLIITRQTTADDIDGWDSIKHINLVVAVEDYFSIRIPTEQIDRLKNVGDLQRVVGLQLAA